MSNTERKDPWYLHQFESVLEKPQKFPDWNILEGKLYQHRPNNWIDPLIEDLDAWKLVLPKELRQETLEKSLDAPEVAHPGHDIFSFITLLLLAWYSIRCG